MELLILVLALIVGDMSSQTGADCALKVDDFDRAAECVDRPGRLTGEGFDHPARQRWGN